MKLIRILSPALVVAVIAASCGGSDSNGERLPDPVDDPVAGAPATDPVASAPATDPVATVPATDPVVSEPVATLDAAPAEPSPLDTIPSEEVSSDEGREPDVVVPEQEVTDLASAPRTLVAGDRYSSPNLGIDIEFTAPRDVLVGHNRPGIIVMVDGYDEGIYTPDTGVAVGLQRWSGWSTRDEAALPTPTASIDPDDVDTWLASNDLVLLSDETTEVAGRPARVFEVTVDPLSDVQAETGYHGQCFAGWEPCFHMGVDASGDEANRFDWVSAKRITRFYLLTIDGSEPLLISVGAAPGSTWFDEIESTFLGTLEIGPDRPPLDPS